MSTYKLQRVLLNSSTHSLIFPTMPTDIERGRPIREAARRNNYTEESSTQDDNESEGGTIDSTNGTDVQESESESDYVVTPQKNAGRKGGKGGGRGGRGGRGENSTNAGGNNHAGRGTSEGRGRGGRGVVVVVVGAKPKPKATVTLSVIGDTN